MTCTNFGARTRHLPNHQVGVAVRVIHQLNLETVDGLGCQHAQVNAEVAMTAVDVVNICLDDDGFILQKMGFFVGKPKILIQ